MTPPPFHPPDSLLSSRSGRSVEDEDEETMPEEEMQALRQMVPARPPDQKAAEVLQNNGLPESPKASHRVEMATG